VCRLNDRLHDVCDRLEDSAWDTCFVIDERGVVLGRLGRRAIRGREDVSAENAMTLGPSTIRPSARLSDMVERMRKQNLTNLPVTTSDGRFVGLLTRQDAEEAFESPRPESRAEATDASSCPRVSRAQRQRAPPHPDQKQREVFGRELPG
jgi:Mg/Co/Ni transporter MgtE